MSKLHMLLCTIEDVAVLVSASVNNLPVDWIVPKGALRGDEALFFMWSKGVVAKGTIASKPKPNEHWGAGRYEAKVSEIFRFDPPISTETVSNALPDWPWLGYPKMYTTPPEDIADILRKVTKVSRDGGLNLPTEPPGVNHEQRAAKAWDVLTERAAMGKTISYKELGAKVGVHFRVLKWPLGLIQDYCLDRYPPLTSLVVHARGDQLPGDGFIAWDVENLADGQRKVYEFEWSAIANPFGYASDGESEESLARKLVADPASSGPIYQLIKVRGPAQKIFRLALMEAYNEVCAFCDFSFREALDAAHILPWSICSPAERMDVRNGILLCANHHRMFDSGWIAITEDYHIEYADIELAEGPYSAADKAVGPELHGARMRVPARKALLPNPALIRRRRALE